jgi:plastocyanin
VIALDIFRIVARASLLAIFAGMWAQSVAAAAGGGTVSGRISLAGSFQKPKALPVFKSRAICGAAVANETLLVGRDGGVKNGAVIIHPTDRPAAALPGELVLDNRRCAFAPHVQVAAVGSELVLKNSDPILHTVHARLGNETLFNVGLPKWRQVKKRLDRAGVVKINCDVLHTWMTAAIVVTDSPYFAVSDERGFFSIDGLPIGDYELEVWHERLGVRKQTLRITEAGALIVDVVYSAEKIR